MDCLYKLNGVTVPPGCPLVFALNGYLDAGKAGAVAADQLQDDLPTIEVAEFEVDELLDYRSRRPTARFGLDHNIHLKLPRLTVYLMTDTKDSPFLLLYGPEPDLRWQRFADEVATLLTTVSARSAFGINGIPMLIPHTRPLTITEHGNSPTVLAESPAWMRTAILPGGVANLLEMRLPMHDVPTAMFSAHVPHYLSDIEYIPAAVGLIDAVAVATGLSLPVPDLRSRADEQLREISAEIADSPEQAELIAELEVLYDEAVSEGGSIGVPGQPPFAATLPDGEDLAVELERYLGNQF